MQVGQLDLKGINQRLSGPGLGVKLGPFKVSITTRGVPELPPFISQLYANYSLADANGAFDFHATLARPRGPRRWLRPKVQFLVDGRPPFEPLPGRLAPPMLEWGINWCIATRAHHFLLLHSAVVEKNRQAVILPAWPGHGKTTLCAGLVLRGWRLFSDEFGIVTPDSSTLTPLPRLLPLKNESIDVIRQFEPTALLGPSFPKTRKGTVAHLCPPRESIERSDETSQARYIIFPRWRDSSPTQLSPMPLSRSFLMLATNSFNYEVLGESAFRTVGYLLRHCQCYSLLYSNLDDVITLLDSLIDEESA